MKIELLTVFFIIFISCVQIEAQEVSLIFSTLLTLFVVPSAYSIFAGKGETKAPVDPV